METVSGLYVWKSPEVLLPGYQSGYSATLNLTDSVNSCEYAFTKFDRKIIKPVFVIFCIGISNFQPMVTVCSKTY